MDVNFYEFGCYEVLEIMVNWLVSAIDKAIHLHREDLKRKRPGAVGHELHVIWVSMIQRPLIKHHVNADYNNCVNLRKKFNGILESTIAASNNPHFIDTEGIFQDRDFDFQGNLAQDGKRVFGNHIDHTFKRFDTDRDKFHLKPRNNCHKFIPAKCRLPFNYF